MRFHITGLAVVASACIALACADPKPEQASKVAVDSFRPVVSMGIDSSSLPMDSCRVGPAPDPRSDWSKAINEMDLLLPNKELRELGTGLLVMRSEVSGQLNTQNRAADSIVLRDAPNPAAPVVARYVVRSQMSGGVRYICRGFSYVADTALQHRMAVFNSNVKSLIGFPVDSVTPDSAWTRVAFAIDTSFAVRYAWADNASAGRPISWPDILAREGPEARIMFVHAATRGNAAGSIRVAPDGAIASVKLPGSAAGYSLILLRIDGKWGQVRIELGDVCDEEEIKRVPGTFWVKLVDERGRPLVLVESKEDC